MTWTVSEESGEFAAAAGPYLRQHPVQNTIVLSVLDTLLRSGIRAFGRDAPLFGWWQPAGTAVAGAFLHTPPYPLLVGGTPAEAVRTLAERLAALGRVLPGVNASSVNARQFAARWRRHTGAVPLDYQRMRLYRLGRLSLPSPHTGRARLPRVAGQASMAGLAKHLQPDRMAPRPSLAATVERVTDARQSGKVISAGAAGRVRLAGAGDKVLLAGWLTAFARESGVLGDRPITQVLDDKLSYGGLFLWEVGGVPVAMSGLTRQVAAMVRIGPGYTPPELRQRGYASAVTAAVSQVALNRGATEVLALTDLANPASNAKFLHLGYQPVEDHMIMTFLSRREDHPRQAG